MSDLGTFARVAIVIDANGTEYVVLEPQLIVDYGAGQGPKGGVITLKDGWIAVLGTGEGQLYAGNSSPAGDIPPSLFFRDSQGKKTLKIAAYDDPSEQSQASVYLHGAPARLHMRDSEGNENVLLNGKDADLWLGGKTANGNVLLFATGEGENRIVRKATIHLNGADATLSLGTKDNERDTIINTVRLDGATGRVSVRNTVGKETIRLDGTGSTYKEENEVGPTENGGIFIVRNALNNEIFRVDYQWVSMIQGNFEQHGRVFVKNTNGKEMIFLDGQHGNIKLEGDITLAGADCAERFQVADEASSQPGTVLVAREDESLASCMEPYDRRVAGVVSGAGRHRPGIILDNNAEGVTVPLSLIGKAYCKVDASYGSISCGDLLTTSETPGHAMRASDRERAFGSVLGKALTSLSEGKGLIPILIALQ